MFKLRTMVTCILFLGSIGSSQATPLGSRDIVYIDGLPCSSACQTYMALYRRGLRPRQTAPVSAQPAPVQLSEQSPKAKAERITRTREERQNSAKPIRTAKKAAKPVEVPPAKIVDLQPAGRGDVTSVPPEQITESPISNPASGSNAGTSPEQVAAAPAAEDLTTAKADPVEAGPVEAGPVEAGPVEAGPALDQKAETSPEPSAPAQANPPADAQTTALASPDMADQLVAILLVRPEIKSVSDLANKVVAIDVSRSESVAGVRTAIVAAGAAAVRMSAGEALALNRVIDGEVPAAVVSLASPEEAEMWSGVQGLKILRVPLSPPSDNARRG